MQIVKIESPEYTCKVPTERCIFELLKQENISDKYRLIETDFISWLNRLDLMPKLYKILSVFNDDKINIVVSQHINTKYLSGLPSNFLIFTPHATYNDNFIPIPHYTSTSDNREILSVDQRSNLFSFKGYTNTHPIRTKLCQLYPSYCFGNFKWGVGVKEYEKEYLDLLSNSIFSLCPLGTGPSSLRIFEALKMGSIPVIISDNLQMPLHSWDKISVKILEEDVERIPQILLEYSCKHQHRMQVLGQEMYQNYFCNNKLHMSIMEYLRD